MKYSGKPILILLVILMLAASQVFALDIDFPTLQKDFEKFSEKMIDALPFYSTIGLNWSDAYIGSFPHFGIGLTAGTITIDEKTITSTLKSLGLQESSSSLLSDKFLLPADSIDARIGIPVIPLDFGVKIGYLSPSWSESLLNVGIKNTLIGLDVRYVIINSKVFPMRLSVGFGFNYLNGGISKTFSDNINFKGNSIGLDDFTAKDPTVDFLWSTNTFELKAQASFPYKIVTPYAGAGVSYSWSKVSYKISASEPFIEEDKMRKFVTEVSKGSFETITKDKRLNTRVFGGISINLAYVRLDLTGMYEFIGGNYGATLGIRFQM
jgi:opacity protein-like surface antigen